jgi:hypothetical protein
MLKAIKSEFFLSRLQSHSGRTANDKKYPHLPVASIKSLKFKGFALGK